MTRDAASDAGFQPANAAERAFERAADAVVAGETDVLGQLLESDPTLASRPSPRAHRATLLHYVSTHSWWMRSWMAERW